MCRGSGPPGDQEGFCMFSPCLHWGWERSIGDSELTPGVNVNVNRCLSLYFSPVMCCRLVLDVLHLLPGGGWEMLQPPHNPGKGEVVEDGWLAR